jgi:integrase
VAERESAKPDSTQSYLRPSYCLFSLSERGSKARQVQTGPAQSNRVLWVNSWVGGTLTKRSLHRLTARQIATINAKGRYADGGGLYLQVGPSRTKSWLFRFMLAGQAREMGLGAIDVISLAEARQRAQEARRNLQDGIDPIEARGAARTAERVAGTKAKLFSQCAAEYIAGHRQSWRSEKHAAQWESTLRAHCYPDPPAAPAWRDVPISAIDTGMVLEVLEPIWKTKTETASRLRGRIETILDWATIRGYRDGLNPARWKGNLDKTLPRRSKVAKVRHHPALPFDELPAFMKSLRTYEGTAPRALELIILTATRTGEAIAATWDEFDLRGHAWTIPAERTKSGREHKVALSGSAVALLRALKASAHSNLVFPGPSGRKALSNMACLALLDRMKRRDITVHGFRSSFRDWAAERTNFPRDVVEMALAHVIPDKTEAAYRRGDLFDKRRKLIEAWAQHCERAPAAVHAPAKRSNTQAPV